MNPCAVRTHRLKRDRWTDDALTVSDPICIDGAVEHLRRAHATVGLDSVAGPGPTVGEDLDLLAAEVFPLRLPSDVERFWRLVDPDRLPLAPWPRPAGPALALRLWRELRAADSPHPRILLPWGYGSHAYLYAELLDRSASYDGVFVQACPDSPYVQTFPSVAAYVDLLAWMIEQGEFVHHRDLGVLEFDPEQRWDDARAAHDVVSRPAAPIPAESDGRTSPRIVALDPQSWPARWRRAEGLSAGAAPSAGPAFTVAELLELVAGDAPADGVLRGRVVGLYSAGSGNRVVVDDGTGVLDIWCPHALCVDGPVIDHTYEFDVHARPGCAPCLDPDAGLRGVERAARAGDLREMVALATPLYDRLFGTPAPARATAIRPAA